MLRETSHIANPSITLIKSLYFKTVLRAGEWRTYHVEGRVRDSSTSSRLAVLQHYITTQLQLICTDYTSLDKQDWKNKIARLFDDRILTLVRPFVQNCLAMSCY